MSILSFLSSSGKYGCWAQILSIHVIGHLKCNRYVDANGNDRVQYEIVAQKVDVAG